MVYSQESWEAAFREAERRLAKKKTTGISIINNYNRVPQVGMFNNNPLLQQALKRPAPAAPKATVNSTPAPKKAEASTAKKQINKPVAEEPKKKEESKATTPKPQQQVQEPKVENITGNIVGTSVKVQATVTDVPPMIEAAQAAKSFTGADILSSFAAPPKEPDTKAKSIINNATSACNSAPTMGEQPQVQQQAQQKQVNFLNNDINASIAAMPNVEAKCAKIRELLATGVFPEINGLNTTTMDTKLDIFKSLVEKLPQSAGRIGGDVIFEIEVNSINNILTNPTTRRQLDGIGAKAFGEKNGKLLYKYKEVAGTNYPALVNAGFKWFFTVEATNPAQYILIAIDPIPLLHKSIDRKTGEQKYFWTNNKRIMLMDATTHQEIQIQQRQ
jgi:hypothetical protein